MEAVSSSATTGDGVDVDGKHPVASGEIVRDVNCEEWRCGLLDDRRLQGLWDGKHNFVLLLPACSRGKNDVT